MFMLVSRRYERASMIVTSNKPFSGWSEIFGDDVVAAAMIDRLIHHAEIIALKGDSYRLRDRDLARPTATTERNSRALPAKPGAGRQVHTLTGDARECIFDRRKGVHLQPALTPGAAFQKSVRPRRSEPSS